MSGGGKGGSDQADEARADEAKREAKINAGTAEINKTFDGYDSGGNQLSVGATYDPTKTYYNADGTAWTLPTAYGSGGGGIASMYSGGPGPGPAPGSNNDGSNPNYGRNGILTPQGFQAVNAAKTPTSVFGAKGSQQGFTPAQIAGGMGPGSSSYRSGVFVGNKGDVVPNDNSGPLAWGASSGGGGGPMDAASAFAQAVANGKVYGSKVHNGGFDDAFWNNRRQSYIDYAQPQIDDQRDDAVKQLTFALDRAGTLDSSVRGSKLADLQKLYDKNELQLNDQAQAYVNTGRSSVEDARANLITELNATGDAEGAANSARARAVSLAAPPQYSPIQNAFQDFTSVLGNQYAQQQTQQLASGTGGGPTTVAGLYGNSKSVRTT